MGDIIKSVFAALVLLCGAMMFLTLDRHLSSIKSILVENTIALTEMRSTLAEMNKRQKEVVVKQHTDIVDKLTDEIRREKMR